MTNQENYWLTPKTLWCQDCGKNFVHYEKGMPQTICSYCAEGK